MPLLLYGTAWKEGRTEALVAQALRLGFRGVDTANQKRHYNEEGVGRALAKAVAAGDVRRSELFLQSKFTFPRGHSPGQEPYSLESSSSSSASSSSSLSSSSSPLSFGSASARLARRRPRRGGRSRSPRAPEAPRHDLPRLVHHPRPLAARRRRRRGPRRGALEALYATGSARHRREQLQEHGPGGGPPSAPCRADPHLAARGWDDRTCGVQAACEELGVVFLGAYVRTEARHI